MECCEDTKMPGMGWRVSLSIVVFFGWVIFLVLWLAFYADNFTIYQNLVVVLLSILVFFAIMEKLLGIMWHEIWTRDERRSARRRIRRR